MQGTRGHRHNHGAEEQHHPGRDQGIPFFLVEMLAIVAASLFFMTIPVPVEPLEITDRLKEKFSADIVDVVSFRDQTYVTVKRDNIVDICRYLHDTPDIYMDYLADLCGNYYPDRRKRFEVVYNLFSIKHRHRLCLKVALSEDDPSVESVCSVWKGANWHEREACDMYGIVFDGHPDLRRILMPEDWGGYPLRKDYPLKGPEDEYKGFEELKELHTHDKEWNIQA